ncbi:hypothetical protein ATN83_1384 [Raoultella ornithinolytica]|nr:hypothetical protein ATN83_1384 [Raoultella ornithinolytica]KDV92341.1 hypothetical protein AB00_3502 [Raoultella ornithinolytica 2-156-04_S1_C1]KDX13568.1 hypothetical protein AB28_3508 [Raoultella ornithinolytica 2-156-04_S1_C2]
MHWANINQSANDNLEIVRRRGIKEQDIGRGNYLKTGLMLRNVAMHHIKFPLPGS